jgi:hypothetical protein
MAKPENQDAINQFKEHFTATRDLRRLAAQAKNSATARLSAEALAGHDRVLGELKDRPEVRIYFTNVVSTAARVLPPIEHLQALKKAVDDGVLSADRVSELCEHFHRQVQLFP